MKLKVGDKVYSPNDLPLAVVFANNEEVKEVISILQDMLNQENKEGQPRWLSAHPEKYFNEKSFDEWSELDKEDSKNFPFTKNKRPRIEL